MDPFRLMRALPWLAAGVFLWLVFTGSAFAYGTYAYGTQTVPRWRFHSSGSCDGSSATLALLKCGVALQNNQPQSNFDQCAWNAGHPLASSATGSCRYIPNGNFLSHAGSINGTMNVNGCAANSTDTGTNCLCNAGYVVNGTNNGCTANAGCQPPPWGPGPVLEVGSALGNTFCYGGWNVTGTMGAQRDGKNYVWGPFTCTNQPCQGSGNDGGDQSPDPPQQCPRGQCPGTVNGTSVCVACSTGTGPPTTTNTQNGSGQNTGSTSSETQCSGASCTTTTTTKDGSGNVTGTQTTTLPYGSFCGANPGHALCSGGGGSFGDGSGSEEEDPEPESQFGGACGGFTCSGDAIQCAIAKEQHTRNCQMFNDTNSLSTIGTQAMSGQNPTDHPKNEAQSTTFALSGLINQTPLFGSSGACPADVTFTHQGMSIGIPFSQWCPYLNLIGAAWVAACMLCAGFIVFRRS